MNQSSILMFTGLGSCYLFLFSLPAQPWGAVFSPTCLDALHALLLRAVQCPRWDGMSAGPGEEEFVYVAACAAAGTGIPELAPTFHQRRWVKSQFEHLPVHGGEPWWLQRDPPAAFCSLIDVRFSAISMIFFPKRSCLLTEFTPCISLHSNKQKQKRQLQYLRIFFLFCSVQKQETVGPFQLQILFNYRIL